MKKTKSLIITALLATLAISCTNENKKGKVILDTNAETAAPTGSLSIKFAGNAGSAKKTTLPEIDMAQKSYKISGTCEDGSQFQLSTEYSEIEIEGLSIGTWDISAEAANQEGVFIAYGNGEVEIIEDQISILNITLTPYQGFGTMEIEVEWDRGVATNPLLIGTLTRSDDIPYEIPLYNVFTISASDSRQCAMRAQKTLWTVQRVERFS